MAAPDFIAAASNFGSTGDTASITIPSGGAGVTSGQRALFVLTTRTVTPSSTPTGLTALPDIPPTNTTGIGFFYVYEAVIGSDAAVNPGATVSFPLSGSSQWATAVYVAGASDIDNTALNGPTVMGASAPFTFATPTTTASDAARVVHIYGTLTNASSVTNIVSWTAHASTTERADTCSEAGSFRNATLMVADEVIGAPGTTSARVATATQRTQCHGMVVVLSTGVTRPIADAGSNQTVAANATGIQLNGTPSDGGGAGGPYTPAWRIITDTTGGASLSSTTVNDPTLDVGPDSGEVVLGYKVTDTADVESLEDTVTITVVGVGSTAVPISDGTTTGWGKEPASASSFYELISDGNDGTYIYYIDPAGNVVSEFPLSELTEPTGSEPVTVWYRPSMFQASSGSVSVILKEGASTVIASFGPDEWGTDQIIQHFEHELSSGQIASITNWANLRLRFEGTVS